MSEEIIVVELAEQPIELCKLLKAANLVGGGGEAKMVISEGYVYVNNEVEFQKRKKIFDQDIVEFNGEQILVECATPAPVKLKTPKNAAPVPRKRNTNKPQLNKPQHANAKEIKPFKENHSTNSNDKNENKTPLGKRKPINF